MLKKKKQLLLLNPNPSTEITIKCSECQKDIKKEFKLIKKINLCKSCSVTDTNKNRTKENHPRWKGGVTSKISIPCVVCNKQFLKQKRNIGKSMDICPDCHLKRMMLKRKVYSGSEHRLWRGGTEDWWSGRRTVDKNGLEWKVQRKDALERDEYKCQKCGTLHFGKYSVPDVHHIIPYRISESHSLDNLKCLCKKCHKIEEGIVDELYERNLLHLIPTHC